VGISGEIVIAGAGLAAGYLNRPELTAERFPKQWGLGDYGNYGNYGNCGNYGNYGKCYRTGDLGRWDEEGNILFMGRLDHQVKIRGFRIEPEEITNRLLQHEAVRQAVTVARSDGGELRLVAYLTTDGPLAAGEPADFIKLKLPAYMVPAFFVCLDEMPLHVNGKINRDALPAPNILGRAGTNCVGAAPFRAPDSALEKEVASIWADLLGPAADQISSDDDFFQLGGHSLTAARLCSQFLSHFGVKIPLRTIFEKPTINGLAQLLEQELKKAAVWLKPIPAEQPTNNGTLTLSFGQQRLWFIQRLETGTRAYNVIRIFRLQGPLDIPRFQQALDEVTVRHQLLRTVITEREGVPLGVVRENLRIRIRVEDLQSLPAALREERILQTGKTEVMRQPDLTAAPPIAVRFLKFSANEWVLFWTTHHIVSDAWSMSLFFHELSVIYNARTRNQVPDLPALTVQYADLAQEQKQRLERGEYQEHLDYWRRQLLGVGFGVRLPYDRPYTLSDRGAVFRFSAAQETLAALKALAGANGATLFMMLLSVFYILLNRYTGQDDLVVGTVLAGRGDLRAEKLIGFFADTLMLRTQLRRDERLDSFLGRVKETCLEAFAHQDLPFEKLVEELNPPRGMQPFTQVMLVLQNMQHQLLDIDGLETTPIPFDRGLTTYPLSMFAMETPAGLELWVEYGTDLFLPQTISRFCNDYVTLLKAAANGGAEIETDRLYVGTSYVSTSYVGTAGTSYGAAEGLNEQLTAAWNAAETEFPAHMCIHHVWAAQACANPEAIALAYRDQCFSYAFLNSSAQRTAVYLKEKGIGRDSAVCIQLERSPLMVVVMTAALQLGAFYVPLTEETADYTLKDCAVQFIVADAEALEIERRLKEFRQPETQSEFTRPESPLVSPDAIAYVMYTSGSTGRPKGVAVTHAGVVSLVCNCDYIDLNRQSKVLQLAPVTFDASTFELWGPLLNGGQCVLFPGQLPALTLLAQQLTLHRINILWLTTALFNTIVDEAVFILAGVKQLLSGGDIMSPTHARKALSSLPQTTLINGYGPTEGTVFTSTYTLPSELPPDIQDIPIGRPISNRPVYILDKQQRPVPAGLPGELYLTGPGTAAGYLNDPERTAALFPQTLPGRSSHNPHSSHPSHRSYKTGDNVRLLPDGNLHYIGRFDRQIKISGYRIEPEAIESTLIRHPGIKACAVTVRGDNAANRRLIAYYTAATPAPEVRALRSFLRETLPAYMLPDAFVQLDHFPRTRSGKIDYLPLPDNTPQRYRPPVTPLERKLAAIWEQLLHVPRVGLDENFFHPAIFAAPTISQLAEMINAEPSASIRAHLLPLRSSGSQEQKVPIFFMHHADGGILDYNELAQLITPGHPIYGIAAGTSVNGYKDILQAATFYSETIKSAIGQ